jgi:hypothetical protein
VTERLPIAAKRPPLPTRRFPSRRDGRDELDRPPGARFGRRLLGTVLLVGSIGLASCHGLVLAVFA